MRFARTRTRFDEFRSFAQQRDFEYVSEAEAHVKELEEMAQEDDFEELGDSIAQLIEQIDTAEERHWQDNKISSSGVSLTPSLKKLTASIMPNRITPKSTPKYSKLGPF